MQGHLQMWGQTERLLHPLVSVITSYHPVPKSLQHQGQHWKLQVVDKFVYVSVLLSIVLLGN